ncbi:MAG: prealbumin-like fold domain-containing protein [Methanomassiliicoccaceae archaeon]|jgi:hypothetical protein|nr:prealbumin-like fold domain-containing protein [Methanomassiliicoccaceae archaeon]
MKKSLLAIAVAAVMLCAVVPVSIAMASDSDPEFGSLTISKGLGDRKDYSGSITGGYEKEGAFDRSKQEHNLAAKTGSGNSWFQFNDKINFDAEDSYTFDLVQGNNLKKVGEYTITYNGGKSFTITFNEQMAGIGAKLSISNTIQGFKNDKDKGFNGAYIWTTAPGQQHVGFSGYSYTFNAPWVEDLTNVKVYIHLDGLSGYVNTLGVPVGESFAFKVTNCADGTFQTVDVPANGSVTLNNLAPGKYVVRELENDYGLIAEFTVNGVKLDTSYALVDVVAGENTIVKAKNKIGEIPPGEITLQKLAETVSGDYVGMAGFDFAVYDSEDKANGVIATATSDENGLVKFGPSYDLIPGEFYYVFETLADNSGYMFGAQGEFIKVMAVDEGTVVDVLPEFYNKLVPNGSLTISKRVGEWKDPVGGSITGGYASEGAFDRSKQAHNLDAALGGKGNWFQFNDGIDFTANKSYTFDLVQGDDLTKVGEYTITWNNETSFTINFADQLKGIGAKMSISNVIDSAGDKKTCIWTASPGLQYFKFGGNSFTFDADWVTDLTDVKVYLHLDGLSGGYVNTFGIPAGAKFDFKVTGPSYPEGTIVTVTANGEPAKLDNLIPGWYKIEEVTPGYIATYTGDIDLTRVLGEVWVNVMSRAVAAVVVDNVPAFGSLEVTAEIEQWRWVNKYEPIYETQSYDTLVSWVGVGKNAAVLPAGFEGKFMTNGFTFFKVDLAALAAAGEDGVDIGIAQSNKSGGNTPNESWNTKIGKAYNLKFVDGQFIVTVDDFISIEFGAFVSDSEISGNPVKHDNKSVYSVNDANGDGFVYFFFHVKAASMIIKQIGWELVDTYLDPDCPAFDGVLSMVVTDADGNEVYSGPLGLVENLMAGEYNVAVFADGKELDSKVVTVVALENTPVDFGKFPIELDPIEDKPWPWP